MVCKWRIRIRFSSYAKWIPVLRVPGTQIYQINHRITCQTFLTIKSRKQIQQSFFACSTMSQPVSTTRCNFGLPYRMVGTIIFFFFSVHIFHHNAMVSLAQTGYGYTRYPHYHGNSIIFWAKCGQKIAMGPAIPFTWCNFACMQMRLFATTLNEIRYGRSFGQTKHAKAE